MSNFTMKNVRDAVIENLSSLKGLEFSNLCNVAEVIKDALEENRYDAPEVSYNSEAWDIVGGSDFDNVAIETLDFSRCENALECLMLEANELLRAAYREQLEEIAYEVGQAVNALFCLTESDFTGASKYSIYEIKLVSGCRLGDISHSLEFDLPVDAAHSVCVWRKQRMAYFEIHGMKFEAELVEVEDDEELNPYPVVSGQ